jgi:predicted Ser/Thr protein kinase
MELHELADAVADEMSFLRFVKALMADKQDEVAKERVSPSSSYGPGANGWENDTIEDYLEAATAWAEDTGFGQNQGLPNNPWRRFAEFLYCGKIYE